MVRRHRLPPQPRSAAAANSRAISTQASSVRPLRVSKFAFTVANHFA
nr:hypothetical protein [Brevundimonas subvibrioides]